MLRPHLNSRAIESPDSRPHTCRLRSPRSFPGTTPPFAMSTGFRRLSHMAEKRAPTVSLAFEFPRICAS
jgi:hypothetical protein